MRLSLKKAFRYALGLAGVVLLSVVILNIIILFYEKSNVHSLNDWSEIDMMINEKIVQPLCELEKEYEKLIVYRTSEQKRKVETLVTELYQNLKEFERISRNNPALKKTAKDFLSYIEALKDSLSECFKACEDATKSFQNIEQVRRRQVAFLEKLMETVIDPNKEKAARKKNVKLLAKWSNIDMVMNEDITQPYLKFERRLEAFL